MKEFRLKVCRLHRRVLVQTANPVGRIRNTDINRNKLKRVVIMKFKKFDVLIVGTGIE